MALKEYAIGFRDMFKEQSLIMLVGFLTMLIVSMTLLIMSWNMVSSFANIVQILGAILICFLVLWQMFGFFVILISLLTRIFCKHLV